MFSNYSDKALGSMYIWFHRKEFIKKKNQFQGLLKDYNYNYSLKYLIKSYLTQLLYVIYRYVQSKYFVWQSCIGWLVK